MRDMFEPLVNELYGAIRLILSYIYSNHPISASRDSNAQTESGYVIKRGSRELKLVYVH